MAGPTGAEGVEFRVYVMVTVAGEHMATAITESIIGRLYDRLDLPPTTRGTAAVACVEGETHQVGGRMVADALELSGWHTWFLGASAPLQELLTFIHEREPDLVALSLTVFFHIGDLERAVRAIRHRFPRPWILVGGQGLKRGAGFVDEWGPRIKALGSLDEVVRWSRSLP